MYTNGLKDRFGSPLISKKDGDNLYAKEINAIKGFEIKSTEQADGDGECNGIQFSVDTVPHDKTIYNITIPVLNSSSKAFYLAAWTVNPNNVKTYVGISDNAATWEEGKTVTWNFNNTPISVPQGHRLEIYLAESPSSVGANEVSGSNYHIKCHINYSGTGTMRYTWDWYSGRDILVYFQQLGHFGDDTHVNAEQKQAIQEVIDDTFVKKNFIRESYDLAYCTDTAEVNGIALNSLYIPHNRTINKVSVLAKDMNLDTPFYLYVYVVNGSVKTRIGLSDNAILWTTDELVTWTFNQRPITIPDGANIEMYLVENEEAAAGLNEPTYASRHIKIACKNNENGAGGTRYWQQWTMNRVVYCFFSDTDYKYIENQVVQDAYLTKTEAHLKFATKEDVKPYDWTPDWVHTIQSTNAKEYTAPTNGWISAIHGDSSGEVSINGRVAGYNLSAGSFTMLLKEGDVIQFDAYSNFLFAPCNAEQCDWRETKTNYDIWKDAICYDSNGTPYIQDLYVPSAASWAENVRIPHYLTITKVEDEKAYNGENFVCNIQSTEIENATFLFYGFNVNGVDTVCEIQTWDSDLPKLKAAGYMFCRSDLSSFSGNLDSLTRGYQMFYNSKLASFNTALPEVVNGYLMFASHTLETFDVDTMPKLSNGEVMFAYTKLSSFSTDMGHLANGRQMFYCCDNLSDFDANLGNLKTGYWMFSKGWDTPQGSPLSDQSISNIANSIKNISGMDRNNDSLWKYDTVDTYGTVKPDAGTIAYDYRGIIHLHCQEGHENNATVTSAMEKIVSEKGWIAYLNGSIYGDDNVTFTIYDVSADNGYIPDASGWRNEIRNNYNLVITRVEDEKAYNGDEFVCNIHSSEIVNGNNLMEDNDGLETWDSDLEKLEEGYYMFSSCSALTSFNSNLSSLQIGYGMFALSSALTSFNSNLPSLTNGHGMFYDCTNLATFTTDLPSLTDGTNMFWSCENLSTFTSELSSLTNGYDMFSGCKLNSDSVSNILNTIPISNASPRFDITMDLSACPIASGIIGIQAGRVIPQYPQSVCFGHKGWSCYLSCANGSYTVTGLENAGGGNTTEYDVTAANGYIPDASAWRNAIGKDLTITRVENGVAYNDNN